MLLFGIVLLGLAIGLVVAYASPRSSTGSPIGPVVFLTALGLWCTVGAILNLRRRRSASEEEPPVKSYVLVKWNVAILAASLAGTLAFFFFGNSAPDPGLLQRVLGIVMVVSLLSVPVVLGLYMVEKAIRLAARRKHRADPLVSDKQP